MIYRYPHPEHFQNWEKPDLTTLKTPLVLWGAGKVGGVADHCLKKQGINYEAFCDIAADKWGTQFCGHEVISPEELKQRYPNATIIITAVCYIDILGASRELGFHEIYDCSSLFMEIDFSDFSFWTSIEYAIRNIEQCLAGTLAQKTQKAVIDQVNLCITTKCSLRCKECAALIPYIKHPQNYDASIILTDFTKVLDSLQHIRVVNFYGGEPTLHPDLAKMIRSLKHESRIDRISIITNGTIIPDENVLQAMQDEPRFLVRISDYGEISRKTHAIIDLLEQHGVRYEVTNYTYWDKGTTIGYYNYTEEKLKRIFKQCTSCNILTLHNRKGYLCGVGSSACNEGIFPESPFNYIDLTNENDFSNHLKNFITRPSRGEYLDACKYCSGGHSIQFEEKVPVAVQVDHLLEFPKLDGKD